VIVIGIFTVLVHDVLPKNVVCEGMTLLFSVFRVGHSGFLAHKEAFFPRQYVHVNATMGASIRPT
jgi:hypothetical protein